MHKISWETSKGHVKIVPRWRPNYDVLRTSQEHQFNALYKICYYNIACHQEAKTIEFIQCLINSRETSQGCANCVLKWRLHSNVLGTSPRLQFVTQYKTHYCCDNFDPTHKMCCVKFLNVRCCLFLKFWRNVLRMPSKRPKKTSVGWRHWDVSFRETS